MVTKWLCDICFWERVRVLTLASVRWREKHKAGAVTVNTTRVDLCPKHDAEYRVAKGTMGLAEWYDMRLEALRLSELKVKA